MENLITMLRELDLQKNSIEDIREVLNYIADELEQHIGKTIDFVEEAKKQTQDVIDEYSQNKEHNQQKIEILLEDISIFDKIIMDLSGEQWQELE